MAWTPISRAAQQREKERKQAADARRGNFRQRGYSTAWTKLSLAWRNEHPLCAMCEAEGRLVSAVLVDHIEPHRGDQGKLFDLENLQSLCASCHSTKTCREDGGFGRPAKR